MQFSAPELRRAFARAQTLATHLRDYLRSQGIERGEGSRQHARELLSGFFEDLIERMRAGRAIAPADEVARLGLDDLRITHAAVYAGRDDEPFEVTFGNSVSLERDQLELELSEQETCAARYLDKFIKHPNASWITREDYENLKERDEQEAWIERQERE